MNTEKWWVICSIALLMLSCTSEGSNPVSQPSPSTFDTLYEFMESQPGKVLHGWGQSGDRWEFEAIPYFEEVAIPLLVSDYVSMEGLETDPNALIDLEKMSSWTDEGGQIHKFIIMECLTNEFDPNDVITALQQLGFDIDPAAPDAKEQVREYMEDPGIRQDVVDIVGFPDENVANGNRDAEIIRLAEAVSKVRYPVLMRFTQEFIGGIHKDDVSGPEMFKQAWIHFVELMRKHGATNAEFVWHPNEGDSQTLEEWWPGDEYVDWVAISIFSSKDFEEARSHSQFAASHDKPFMIAESAPTLNEFTDRGTQDESTWNDFFNPYFELIEEDENIKAFFYINIDWSNSQFEWPISRVQENEFILNRYKQELQDPVYLTTNELWTEFE